MCMQTYTQTYIYTYTYIHTCPYTRTHAQIYTYACICDTICTRMHRQKILTTTPPRVKQYHRRTYASICICIHIHTYVLIHICTQPAASAFADVYVGVKTHLCNIHTCPCTSAQTLVKSMQHSLQNNAYIYIPTHICIRIHMYTKTHAHA